jgi:hypothetical protein
MPSDCEACAGGAGGTDWQLAGTETVSKSHARRGLRRRNGAEATVAEVGTAHSFMKEAQSWTSTSANDATRNSRTRMS